MKKNIFFWGIIILASLLRFIGIGSNPPSLTWDEVALGYNAYTLGIDGRDEFGRFLPYDYLESFGDFKPPVYSYVDILPIKVFGLNEFAVRFPSAFFGVLTVLLTYFLVLRIFSNAKDKKYYALVSMFFLAVSPWHIMLSRAAFEANIATFFIVLGVYCFLCGVQEKKWFLILSVISLVLSLYTFNSTRIIAPLLGMMLVVGFHKKLLERKKQAAVALVAGVVLVLPIVGFLFSEQASLRFKEVNIFTNIDVIERTNQEVANDKNNIISKIIHNRRLAYGVEFLKHYLDHFDPQYLFIKGDNNPKFSTQDTGQMYLFDIPFLIIGAFFLFKKRENAWWIIPLWLLLAIIPAATARETPHALRTEATLPTFQIVSAYGFVVAMKFLQKKKKGIYLLFLGALFINVLYFLQGYMFHYAKEYSAEWQYGYKESIAYVEEQKDKYNEVRITADLGRPYVYYLFYQKIDPNIFRKTALIKRDAFGFVDIEGFGKYRFDKTQQFSNDPRILYISTPQSVPKNAEVLKTFYLRNGLPSLVAFKTI